MTETTTIEREGRDGKTGQFLKGFSGGPGRKVGSRNRLGEQFVEDLRTVWTEEGIDALRRCAREDATGFCRIISGLLPRDVNLNLDVSVDALGFAEKFRNALALLGNEPGIKTIEHVPGKRR
jgi:hypothetical protein